jgi:hypothetical protein
MEGSVDTAGNDEETSKNSTRMAYFQIPPPDVLSLNDGSTASNWREWKSAWSNYTLATKLDKEDEARQVATLLAVIGKEANKVFKTFVWGSEDDSKKIDLVIKKFEEYCIPRQNKTDENRRKRSYVNMNVFVCLRVINGPQKP